MIMKRKFTTTNMNDSVEPNEANTLSIVPIYFNEYQNCYFTVVRLLVYNVVHFVSCM